jgi:hypothetical protein
MSLRIAITISLFVGGYLIAGFHGMYGALLVWGILGLVFGAPKNSEPTNELAVYEAQERMYERVEHARKGSAYDPTRPGYDDHPLLLTNEFRRVQ